jgi:citrate synthase
MHAAVSNNQPIIGFGHPVYKHGDASAQIMKTVSRELGEKTGDLRWHELCEQIEEFMLQKNLYHTVNFYSGPVLALLGVPAALCTPIFAAGRIAGWSAHVIEQLENNWVFRPRFKYRGPKNLSYIPLGSRSSKINGTFLLQKQATVSEKQH